MTKKDFLEEKFTELNQLKTILLTYPKDYKDSIIEVMEGVCNKVTKYLDDCKNHTFRGESLVNKKFTLQELANYNGKNGMPAYISINSNVYLVKNNRVFNENIYGLRAGKDLTDFFSNSNIDINEVLGELKLIGVIVPEMSRRYRENVIMDMPTEFTINELQKYNGRNGMAALVAINGTVYDVADVKAWQNGVHFGVMAGKDVTKAFLNCHSENKDKILSNLRVVGTLID